MAKLIIFNNEYTGLDVYYRVLDYALCPAPEKKTAEYIGSVNLYTDIGVSEIARQMIAVAEYYRSTGGQLLRHFCLSFDTYGTERFITMELAYQIGMQICGRLLDSYQVAFAVHGGDIMDKCVHIHFIVNAISCVDGKRFLDKRSTYKEIAKCIGEIPVYIGNDEKYINPNICYRSNPKYKKE